MSITDQVILYDLRTKKPEYGCWSPNVWKTRLALNYKNIPYDTHWLLHPDIKPTLSGLSFTPNPRVPGDSLSRQPSPYTVPAVKLPDGSFAMDSAIIAPKLEQFKPEPPLHLENSLHEELLPIIGQIARPLLGVIYPRIARDVLVEETVPGWKAKHEAQLGMPLEEYEAALGGDTAWKAAEPGLQVLSKFVIQHKKDEGPFLLGSQVCYGDFVIAGLVESCRRIGQDIYGKLVSYDENFEKLHDACKVWFENDR